MLTINCLEENREEMNRLCEALEMKQSEFDCLKRKLEKSQIEMTSLANRIEMIVKNKREIEDEMMNDTERQKTLV